MKRCQFQLHSTGTPTNLSQKKQLQVYWLRSDRSKLTLVAKSLPSNILSSSSPQQALTIEIPLTVGMVGGIIGAAFFPIMAAVGSIGAMVAHLTIVVEKRE
jgi:Domain of unknown function (DUF4342)